MTEAAVIGAGVAGLVCACELVDRKVSVEVYERSVDIGPACCSWFAGGMLAPYCERDTAEIPVMQQGLLARDWWQRHVSDVTSMGSLVVSLQRDRNEIKRLSRLGKRCEWIEPSKIGSIEPDLKDFPGPGLWFPDEAHLDPRQALLDMVGYLKHRAVPIHFGEAVDPGDVNAEFVIDCRGYAARETLQGLRGVKGEMLLLHTDEIQLRRPVRLLHPRQPIYVVPRRSGLYMLGATAIETDESHVSARSMLDLLHSLFLLDSRFGEAAIVEMGAEVRPAYHDNQPKLSQRGHVISVNGLFRHGFLLGPSLAIRVADIVLGQRQGEAWSECG